MDYGSEIALYNLESKEWMGLFESSSLAAKFIFRLNDNTRGGIRVRQSATGKGNIHNSDFKFAIKARFCTTDQKKVLGDEKVILFDNYKDIQFLSTIYKAVTRQSLAMQMITNGERTTSDAARRGITKAPYKKHETTLVLDSDYFTKGGKIKVKCLRKGEAKLFMDNELCKVIQYNSPKQRIDLMKKTEAEISNIIAYRKYHWVVCPAI